MKETFGQRFSRFRKQRGLKQEELGEKLGVSGQAVSKWENDASMPDVSLLVEISEILGISYDAAKQRFWKAKKKLLKMLKEGEQC